MSRSTSLSAPLAPGATIGILGGGQLGRMLALAAARLGFKSHVFSDETESCAFYVADATTRAQYSDKRALEKFAAACDVVTFEFENVPDATAHFLADHVPVAPNARSLAIAQDRFLEKSFIAELGYRDRTLSRMSATRSRHRRPTARLQDRSVAAGGA